MDETKVCIRCGKEKPLGQFKMSWRGKYRKNQCASCYSRWFIAKWKLDFLRAFDFKCSCCGERQPFFLTLDHKNNDGGEHRRNVSQVTILYQARREGFDKSKWDCLCMNCNFAKGHYGVCPHQQGKSPDDILGELRDSCSRVSRKHVQPASRFTGGFDERRMQLERRNLQPCPYCDDGPFGTNELVRHKREFHVEEMKARKAECLRAGRGSTRITEHGTSAKEAESVPTSTT